MSRFAVIQLLVAIVLSFTIVISYGNCPCIDAATEFENYATQRNLNLSTDTLTLCVLNARTSVRSVLRNLTLPDIHIEFTTLNEYQQGDCNMLMNVVYNATERDFFPNVRQVCPGICRPVPEIKVSHLWLQSEFAPELIDDTLITCTLSSSMLSKDHYAANNLKVFLVAIFWRRIMECYERKFWHSRYLRQLSPPFKIQHSNEIVRSGQQVRHDAFDQIKKRKILATIVWVGSKEKIRLIEEQAKVLSEQPMFGVEGVLGWAATDEVYPCRRGHTQCRRGGLSKYKYLPGSAINYMPPGWGCAQRRPLRSLAHILTLVDPTFLILLDDDTYLNYILLMRKYGNDMINGDMIVKPLVMGELGGGWGDTGHLSKWGIYAGGAGYIIGKKAIQVLVSHEVKYFNGEGLGKLEKDINDSDLFRSDRQIYSLSVYREGMESSMKYCQQSVPSKTASDSCILSDKPYNSMTGDSTGVHYMKKSLVIPIAVRLIDFCTNLMANENTCHHR